MDLRPHPPLQWHIEAWSVRDGMAFASYRPRGSISTAQRSVFIGVPALEVVPLGSTSLALWATRANFQVGLHDFDGQEIGFQSLEQVRELVRRGYLAGGMGPAAPENVDGPNGGPPGLGELLDRAFMETLRSEGDRKILTVVADRSRRDEYFRSLSEPTMVPRLFKLVQTFASATLALWWYQIAPARAGPPRPHTDLILWMHALVRLGLWDDPDESWMRIREFLLDRARQYEDLRHDLHYSWRYWSYMVVTLPNPFSPSAPCPVRSNREPRFLRLSDKILALLAAPSTIGGNADLADLAPAILVALLATAPSDAPASRSLEDFGERLRVALEWLAAQMTQQELPMAAEAALQRFVLDQLAPPLANR